MVLLKTKKWLMCLLAGGVLLSGLTLQAEAAGDTRVCTFNTVSSAVYRFPETKWAVPTGQNKGSGSNNPYKTLKVATQITKIGDMYFLVDCYHNQVLWSNSLDRPLERWKIVTNEANQPHTIAGDGTVYLVDDTENHRVMVFEKKDGKFIHTQTVPNVGMRPHYIVYDGQTNSFYAWSSLTGEMYILKRNPADNRIYVDEIRSVKELYGIYVRSFTMEGEHIYFPAGTNGQILCVDKNTFEVQARYPVPEKMAGMVQVSHFADAFYITVSTDLNLNQGAATMVRTPSLEHLSAGIYEEVYDAFGKGGTPYYISSFDGSFYLTNHRTSPGVWKFSMDKQGIGRTEELYP